MTNFIGRVPGKHALYISKVNVLFKRIARSYSCTPIHTHTFFVHIPYPKYRRKIIAKLLSEEFRLPHSAFVCKVYPKIVLTHFQFLCTEDTIIIMIRKDVCTFKLNFWDQFRFDFVGHLLNWHEAIRFYDLCISAAQLWLMHRKRLIPSDKMWLGQHCGSGAIQLRGIEQNCFLVFISFPSIIRKYAFNVQ